MKPIRLTVTKVELKRDLKPSTPVDPLVTPGKEYVQVTLMDASADVYVSLAVPTIDAERYTLGQAMELLLVPAALAAVSVADTGLPPTLLTGVR